MTKPTTPPPFTLRITGTRAASRDLHTATAPDATTEEYFRVDDAFRLDADARGERTVHEKPQASDAAEQIVRLEADDQTEWIGLPDDLPDVFGEPAEPRRGGRPGEQVFTIPASIRPVAPNAQRGVIKAARVKLVEFISRRAPGASSTKEHIAIKLAERVDRAACPQQGLFRVEGAGLLGAQVENLPATTGRALLLIHGTASGFVGGFAGIEAATWDALRSAYPGGVFAFNHYTVTQSPVRNALELLRVLPKGLHCDLVTHSRGGLVGDVLARCDTRRGDAIGFSEQEIDGFREEVKAAYEDGEGPEVGDTLATELAEVTALARSKDFTLRRLVRVASPSAGTTLLSERLDHYLNAVLNVLKLAAGGVAAPIIGVLRAFLLAVVDERRDPDSFPGLFAMVPESPYSVLNNNPLAELPSTLVSVAGDSEFGGKPLQSLKVMLSNLYYWGPNDLVVDTASMSRGIQRRAEHFQVLIEDKTVDHFTYFNHRDRMAVVLAVLTAEHVATAVLPKGFTLDDLLRARGRRGVIINSLYDLGEVKSTPITGTKPIVVLLPGIMGSNLSGGGRRQWMRLSALMAGGLVDDLHVDAEDVSAVSAMDDFYGELVRYLVDKGFEVEVFAFDWRLSLKQAGAALDTKLQSLLEHKQPLKLLAHSMGGLVVRQLMIDHSVAWRALRDLPSTRTVLLGTPWRGSHLVTEVLSGHSSRVRQLYLLDLKHTKRRILETIGAYPGVLELLPLDEPLLRTTEEWGRITDAAGRGVPQLDGRALETFQTYQAEVVAGINELRAIDFERLTYVAGSYDETVDGYGFEYRRFRRRQTLRYRTTPLGDGSVTWARGIPGALPEAQVYYAKVEHGRLCATSAIFGGILDLLERGTTRSLPDAPLVSIANVAARGSGKAFAKTAPYPVASITALTPQEALFGIRPASTPQDTDAGHLRIEIFNGDLLFADYPVVVGHFANTGVVGAERAVDTYLKGALSERHRMGFYPGDIGTQEVLFDPDSKPQGAIVVGLGDQDQLTTSALTQTVEKGLLKYALFQRDNRLAAHAHPGGGHGVSMLLVGSNYGQLSMRECVRSLVQAAQHANAAIAALNAERRADDVHPPLRPITVVELVDYFEDRAFETFQLLSEMVALKDLQRVVLPAAITPGFGKRRRFLREESRSWWQTLTTCAKSSTDDGPADRLEFTAANRGASVSADTVFGDLDLPRAMADAMAKSGRYDPADAKVLFELLIPNRYKDFLRSHRNVLWRFDRASAALPWELFHDTDTGDEPTFVRAGMVRQLESRTAEVRPSLVRGSTALVIGDPELGTDATNFGQLAGARAEAEAVVEQLGRHGFVTNSEIGSSAIDIVRALFGSAYKIVHIAAHGTFNADEDEARPGAEVGTIPSRTGIVLGDGQRLTPGRIQQLSAIPELVFVNCCYGGVIDGLREDYRRTRYRLAANVGTQLIEIGVQAVVVAGWEVDDAAAKAFAKTFYDDMLSGRTFGEAIRRARQTAYEQFPDTNTWGAYQAYGDPFYRAVIRDVYEESDELNVHLAEELTLEFDNLVSRVRSIPYSHVGDLEKVRRQAAELEVLARERGLMRPAALERQGMLHLYLGSYPQAIDAFERLIADDGAGFAVSTYLRLLHTKAKHIAAEAFAKTGKGSTESAYRAIVELIEALKSHTLETTESGPSKSKNAKSKTAKPVAAEPEQADGSPTDGGLPDGSTAETKATDAEIPAPASPPYALAHRGVRVNSQWGSMCKRAAALSPNNTIAKARLSESAAAYLAAAKDLGILEAKAIYHVCEYITFEALQIDGSLKPKQRKAAFGQIETKIKANLGEIPADYFARWKDRRRYYTQERNSSYSALREANLAMASLVWDLVRDAAGDQKLSPAAVETRVAALIEIHARQRREGFNLRDLRGQAEHYRVLMALGERFGWLGKEAYTALEQVYHWVEVMPSGAGVGGAYNQA